MSWTNSERARMQLAAHSLAAAEARRRQANAEFYRDSSAPGTKHWITWDETVRQYATEAAEQERLSGVRS